MHPTLGESPLGKEQISGGTLVSKGCDGRKHFRGALTLPPLTSQRSLANPYGPAGMKAWWRTIFQKRGENFGWVENRERDCGVADRPTLLPHATVGRMERLSMSFFFSNIVFINDSSALFFFCSCQEFPRSDLNWQRVNPANKHWVRSWSLIHLSHRWPLCFLIVLLTTMEAVGTEEHAGLNQAHRQTLFCFVFSFFSALRQFYGFVFSFFFWRFCVDNPRNVTFKMRRALCHTFFFFLMFTKILNAFSGTC